MAAAGGEEQTEQAEAAATVPEAEKAISEAAGAAGADVGAAGLAAAAVAGAALVAAGAADGEGSAEAEKSAAIAAGAAVATSESEAGDDLTMIEGIGPKAAALLTSKGITTFDELANTDVKVLRSTLNRGRMGFVDPTTWPDQAKLAAAGQMDELRAMQAQLKGGKVVPPDPLTRIEGIGAKDREHLEPERHQPL